MLRHGFAVACLALLVAASLSVGNEPQKGSAARSARPDDKLPPFTPEREAAALMFARLHHAELADLLEQLKTVNEPDYTRAVRELFRTSETLAQTQERDPRRYELDLEAWKINSRIHLLAARLSMAASQELEDQLLSALREQIDVRLRQQELQRERLQARLEELTASIEKTRENKEQQAEKQLEKLKRGVGRTRPAAGPPSRRARPLTRPPENRSEARDSPLARYAHASYTRRIWLRH